MSIKNLNEAFFTVNNNWDSFIDKSQELIYWIEIHGLDFCPYEGDTLVKWLL